MKGDFQAGFEYYDDSYQGWQNGNPVPISKSDMIKNINYGISLGVKAIFYNAIPTTIWVNGNYAYTDYYYDLVWLNKDGKKTSEHGRWLDVLMKKNGKWLLVGDHGGEDPSPAAK